MRRSIIFWAGPDDESLGEFEIRLDRWLNEVASDTPALPKEALKLSRDAARKARMYRNCRWE
jgi:hypothetical protein